MYRRVNKAASSLALTFLVLSGCRGQQDIQDSSVEITLIPPADKGGPDTLDRHRGPRRGGAARAAHRPVRAGRSLVGPAREPRALHRDPARTRHLEELDPPRHRIRGAPRRPRYRPPTSVRKPSQRRAAAIRGLDRGRRRPPRSEPTARSAVQRHEWIVRSAPSDRGGRNAYDPDNAWTDEAGRDAPPHRGTSARTGRARRSASRAVSATARIGSSCATSRTSSRRPSSACSRMTATAARGARTTAR